MVFVRTLLLVSMILSATFAFRRCLLNVGKSTRLLARKKSGIDNLPVSKVSEGLPFDNAEVITTKSTSDVSFTVYGDPIALNRHRVSARGIMYNPSAKFQKIFLESCMEFLPENPLEGPVELSVMFHFKRPKNHFGTGKNAAILKKGMSKWHSKRSGICTKDVKNDFYLYSFCTIYSQTNCSVSILT